ncbi:MAG: hypothetical protein Q8M33_18600, partial [Hydrogenophaga sp.]|nr:hypothetical protein [Hydrogenophaga sp.]
LLVFLLNLLWAAVGVFTGFIPNSHYDMPFLSAGQMSLAAVLLLLAVWIVPKQSKAKQSANGLIKCQSIA